MAETKKLYELVKVLRSKNSGPFELTFDIIFDDEALYEKVRDAKIINQDLICARYNIQPEDIYTIAYFDMALAIKITIRRPVVSGGVGETDVYGAQQHAPLMNIEIPLELIKS